MSDDASQLDQIEVDLLPEGIFRRYGFDFRDYARASLLRRVRKQLAAERLETVSALQERVLHDPACWDRFLGTMSVSVSAMFRDPDFYRALREQIVPKLRTWPFLRIWIAGCAGGEEVYSLAILLEEEGLGGRYRIYATDMSAAALEDARRAIFPLAKMKEFTENYLAAGGRRAFSEYYTARYDGALFHHTLREGVVFFQHNLATDGPFNEFQLVLCRNVLIYFNKKLQERVHQLLFDSLATFGALGLGSRESVRFLPLAERYEPLDAGARLYRKRP